MSAPINPADYPYGVNVVKIDDLRIARGRAKRPYSKCKHRNLSYDEHERRVYCCDCNNDVESFDAFVILVEIWDSATKNHNARERKVAEAEATSLISRAAKAIDEEWRKKRTIPACPHCNDPLLPEDFVSGKFNRVSADIARQKRKRGQL